MLTVSEARDLLDTIDPANITVADYPAIARGMTVLRDAPHVQRDGAVLPLVNRVLRDLYRYCEHTGQSWSNWLQGEDEQ